MNKSQIVRAVAMSTKLTQAEAREAIDAFVDMIALCAKEDDDVTIAGFGKFVVRNREEAIRTNPGTGEKVTVPARKTVNFRSCQSFRSRI